MNDIDYARIHLNVAIRVWQDSDRWALLFPTYPHFTALRVEAAALALDMAVADTCLNRFAAPVAGRLTDSGT